MALNAYPKGAGLGRDVDRRRPGLVDFDWTMQHGSRAQRREIQRQLEMYRRRGVPGADDALTTLAGGARRPAGVHLRWRVILPGREPFVVSCAHGATASQVRAQWPGAVVEVADGE